MVWQASRVPSKARQGLEMFEAWQGKAMAEVRRWPRQCGDRGMPRRGDDRGKLGKER
jgi:hypothetical protein